MSGVLQETQLSPNATASMPAMANEHATNIDGDTSAPPTDKVSHDNDSTHASQPYSGHVATSNSQPPHVTQALTEPKPVSRSRLPTHQLEELRDSNKTPQEVSGTSQRVWEPLRLDSTRQAREQQHTSQLYRAHPSTTPHPSPSYNYAGSQSMHSAFAPTPGYNNSRMSPYPSNTPNAAFGAPMHQQSVQPFNTHDMVNNRPSSTPSGISQAGSTVFHNQPPREYAGPVHTQMPFSHSNNFAQPYGYPTSSHATENMGYGATGYPIHSGTLTPASVPPSSHQMGGRSYASTDASARGFTPYVPSSMYERPRELNEVPLELQRLRNVLQQQGEPGLDEELNIAEHKANASAMKAQKVEAEKKQKIDQLAAKQAMADFAESIGGELTPRIISMLRDMVVNMRGRVAHIVPEAHNVQIRSLHHSGSTSTAPNPLVPSHNQAQGESRSGDSTILRTGSYTGSPIDPRTDENFRQQQQQHNYMANQSTGQYQTLRGFEGNRQQEYQPNEYGYDPQRNFSPSQASVSVGYSIHPQHAPGQYVGHPQGGQATSPHDWPYSSQQHMTHPFSPYGQSAFARELESSYSNDSPQLPQDHGPDYHGDSSFSDGHGGFVPH